MIQISYEIYINKNQILYIKRVDDYFEIYMTSGKFYVYKHNYGYYQNVKNFLEGNNE